MKPEDKKLNEGEFLRLFVKSESALRTLARTLLPTWESVDEVMQESSVIMWKKLDQLEHESGFLPWAKMIVRYEALRVRRTAARDRLILSESVTELLADESLAQTGEEWQREHDALRKCLSKFPAQQQELLLAPHVGDGRVKAIAAASNRSANSLYKLMGRLREKLVICIESELAAGAP